MCCFIATAFKVLIESFSWKLRDEDHIHMASILKNKGMSEREYKRIISVSHYDKITRASTLVHAMHNMMKERRNSYTAVKHLLSSVNNKDVDMLVKLWEDYCKLMLSF